MTVIMEHKEYFVHPSSFIDDNVTVGEGTKIWHFCHVQTGASLGHDCSLGQNVYVGSNVRIGNGVRIQNNVSVYDGVEIEDNVFCGPSCVFTNVLNPRAHFPVHGLYGKTIVREGASLSITEILTVLGGELHDSLRSYHRPMRSCGRRRRCDRRCTGPCACGRCARAADRLGV